MTRKRQPPVPEPVQLALLDRNKTRIVNLRDEPGWQKDPRYVYCGRRRGAKAVTDPREIPAGQLGALGNPFDVREFGIEESLRRCEEYVRARVERDPAYRAQVFRLEGKILGCYCVKPNGAGPCHCRIFIKLHEERRAQKQAQKPPDPAV